MIPRRALTILVFGLPVLVVAFAVLAGAAALADALRDSLGARCLAGAAVTALLLLIGDVVLLVGLLGWIQLASLPERPAAGSRDAEFDGDDELLEHESLAQEPLETLAEELKKARS